MYAQWHVTVNGRLEKKLAKDKNVSGLSVALKIRKVSECSCDSNSQRKAVDVTRVSRRNNVTARISAGNLTTEDRMNQAAEGRYRSNWPESRRWDQ